MFGYLLLGLGAYLLLRGASTASALTTAQVRIDLSGMRINGSLIDVLTGAANLLLPLSITNRTGNPVRFGGFTGAINLAGTHLAAINYNAAAMLPAHGTLTIDVPLTITAGGAWTAIYQAITERRTDVLVTGRLVVDGITLPINQTVPIVAPAA